MDCDFNLESEINNCKKEAMFLKDINLKELPETYGIVAIFIDDIKEILFKEKIIEDKEVDPYLLKRYIEKFNSGILYYNNVKNIKNEIRKFMHSPRKNASKPEIIFNQIENNSVLRIGFKEISEDQYKNETAMLNFVAIYHQRPVMNSQFKSNDATPSWNGFNYQGFLTVLRTLEYLNKLSEQEYKNYSVEIEKYEDFIISPIVKLS